MVLSRQVRHKVRHKVRIGLAHRVRRGLGIAEIHPQQGVALSRLGQGLNAGREVGLAGGGYGGQGVTQYWCTKLAAVGLGLGCLRWK